MALIKEAVEAGARKAMACEILGLQIRTIERWEYAPEDRRRGPLNKPSNALTKEERGKVVEIANSPEFCNLPPCQIVPKLADQGKYVASESTFYRILKEMKLLAHRSRSNPRSHAKPQELVATGPNMIWSWDISYLKAAIKGMYYYLYLPMDIFSRKIVHWEIHEHENAENAANMIKNASLINGIKEGEVVLHSDNGSPMKGATMLATLQSLGITPSFSRPKVSDDNPYSESLFKTLKYCPGFPERGFRDIEEARSWVEKFVDWYNNIHLHSGINFVTPSSRHEGADKHILSKRKTIYEKARSNNPARWSKNTRNWQSPEIVELNPGRHSKELKKKKAA